MTYVSDGIFGPTYILIIIGVIITLAASAKMNSAFRRYSGPQPPGLTGAIAATKNFELCGIL